MKELNIAKYVLAGLIVGFSGVALAIPNAPTLVYPANNPTSPLSSPVTFKWYQSSLYRNPNYRIVISQTPPVNNTFSGFVDNYSGSYCKDNTCFTGTYKPYTNGSQTISYPKSLSCTGHTYYWKVRVNDDTGASSWSVTRSFKTTGSSDSCPSKVWPLTSHSNIPFVVGSYNYGSYHTGLDIMTTLNTPVYAMCSGVVAKNFTKNTWGTGYKNYWNSFLIVKHNCGGDIIYGYYGHLTSSLAENASVSAGQVIGNIRMAKSPSDQTSSYGIDNPSNNHLHFGLNRSYLSTGWGYADTLARVTSLGWLNPKTYLPL